VQVVDSSVIIRAVTTVDISEREQLQDLIADSPIAIAHVLAEAFATLTRLPQPFRLSPLDCHAFLTIAFHAQPMSLSPAGYLRILEFLAERDLVGGASYDCLIAETARENNAVLVSLDHRAAVRYSMLGVEHRLV
jgi:predicted nucleic acid-binding protein